MRSEIKALNQQHRQALAALESIDTDIGNAESKLKELAALESSLTPVLAVDAGDIESIVAQRLAEQQRQLRREAIADVKADWLQRLEILKHQRMEAKFKVNGVAAGGWPALAESLVAEHTELLRHIGQVAERGQFPLARFFKELPDMTPDEVETVEAEEGFPQWI